MTVKLQWQYLCTKRLQSCLKKEVNCMTAENWNLGYATLASCKRRFKLRRLQVSHCKATIIAAAASRYIQRIL